MGRAYEVRKVSIQKTGAVKAKIYSMFAKEIYQAAKDGGIEADSNFTLKHLIDKAREEQVPSDIIKRAIEKVNSGANESYVSAKYEIFGPGGSTVIVDCLTDNLNRSISSIRTALNKTNSKMGVSGSASFMYDNLSVISFKNMSEEAAINALIEANVDIDDIETDQDSVIVYGKPTALYEIKEALIKAMPNITFETNEITMFPKEKIVLQGEDLFYFNKLITMLDDIEDVKNVYHNVII